MKRNEISNTDSIIDSRDILNKIEELEDELSDLNDNLVELEAEQADMSGDDYNTIAEYNTEYARLQAEAEQVKADIDDLEEKLKPFKDIADECSHYGETLIHEDYFAQYAQEIASDLHGRAVDNAEWPFNCIDWDEAADALKQDYTEVDFDGETYFIR